MIQAWEINGLQRLMSNNNCSHIRLSYTFASLLIPAPTKGITHPCSSLFSNLSKRLISSTVLLFMIFATCHKRRVVNNDSMFALFCFNSSRTCYLNLAPSSLQIRIYSFINTILRKAEKLTCFYQLGKLIFFR